MTRLFLPSSGAAAISPSFAAWDDTASSTRLAAVDVKGSTAMATATSLSTNPMDGDLLVRQYVFPLPAGVAFTTAQTVKGQIRASETLAINNARAQTVIRVMTSASVVRATLRTFDVAALSSEFATTLTNRKFPRGSPVTLAANYTSVAGDYLVMEFGAFGEFDEEDGVSLRFGDTAASALAEDESSTADNYPWIEFSTDLSAVRDEGYSYLF